MSKRLPANEKAPFFELWCKGGLITVLAETRITHNMQNQCSFYTYDPRIQDLLTFKAIDFVPSK
jgi:hypothetical protein